MEIKTANELHEILSSEKKLVLVDFFATWCGPCRMLSPVLESVANEFSDSLKVVKVDVDKFSQLTNEYNVHAMPTLVFIKDGQEVGRQMGYMTQDDLADLVTKYSK